jgi:hypothetical protein
MEISEHFRTEKVDFIDVDLHGINPIGVSASEGLFVVYDVAIGIVCCKGLVDIIEA